MKYKFNKILSLLIKQEENTKKPHFGPDLGLLGPNLDVDVKHCPKLQSCAISTKTADANVRKWPKA